MVTFCGRGLSEKQEDILKKQLLRHALQDPLKYLVKLTGEHEYRSLCFKKKLQDVSLKLYLKRGSCLGFFLRNV